MKTWRRVTGVLTIALLSAALAACGLAKKSSQGTGTTASENDGKGAAAAVVTLKLSHQWPQATKDSGDFRGQLAVRFAEEVEMRTNGSVKVEIFPSSSLVKPKEQWDAIQEGAIDLAIYPLDYASGKVPQFDISMMPALVKNHAQAQAWKEAEIGKRLEQITDQKGVKILTWIWNAGGIGSKGKPIVSPRDVKQGMKMRAAGKRVEAMLQKAGAGITSMASSEIYSAFQTGVLDAAITSASSFGSYKLFEQVDAYVTPTKNTFWFMFEPLIIGKKSLEKLTPEQQAAVLEAGAALQTFAYEASQADDAEVAKMFTDAGVQVVEMDDASYQEWTKLAEEVWNEFAAEVEGGKELIELAKQVQP
jgi:TRAP-type C4-dicarboxylate transport system substrate-binding protein